jgi:ATP-dependent Lhr-like helicase
MRQKPANDVHVAVSGADPLNLVGSIVAGNKVPALTNSKILYRDGVPIATLISGEFTALEPMDAAAEWTAKSRLLRHESLMPAAADAVADEHAAVGDNTIN